MLPAKESVEDDLGFGYDFFYFFTRKDFLSSSSLLISANFFVEYYYVDPETDFFFSFNFLSLIKAFSVSYAFDKVYKESRDCIPVFIFILVLLLFLN